MSRTVTPKVLIAWDGTNYVDETVNFISASGNMRMTAPGASIVSPKGTVDAMSLVLYNRDETTPYSGKRYSPLNTGGSLYNYIKDGGAYHRPVKFEVSIDGGAFSRVFTGIIKIPQEGAPTAKQEATVSIECRSLDELLLQLKLSTSGASIKAYADTPTTEDVIIEDILDLPEVNVTFRAISSGFFTIPFFWMDDESVLEELWAITSACGGRLYSGRDGKLIYKNMQEWVTGASGQKAKTFTRADYTDLKVKYNDEDLYNIVTVEASPRRIGENSVLWEPDENITVPANGTREITAKLRQPAYFLNEISFQATTSGGASISSNVSVNATVQSQRVDMVFTNTHPTQMANIQTLQIKGIPVIGAPTIEERVESTDSFWSTRTDRTRSVRSNNYVQSRAHAKGLAQFLLNTSEKPKLLYTISNTPGVPSYSLGDLIGINDTKIMSSERSAFITGISWSYTAAGGYKQTIEAIDTSTVLKYPADEYFIIGVDIPGDCVTTGERVYY